MHAFLQIVASNAAVFAVLAACITLLGRFWKNPVGLHLLWVLALLKLITPPLITVPLPLPTLERPATAVAAVLESSGDGSGLLEDLGLGDVRHLPPSVFPVPPTASPISDGPAPDEGVAATIDASLPISKAGGIAWPIVPLWTWAIGTVLFASVYAFRILRFRRVLRAAQAPSPALVEMAEGIAQRLSLRKVPEIWLLPVRLSPLVWWLGGRPRVLLPRALFEKLDLEAQQAILTHEVTHIRRKDHWVRLLELAMATLFWWHPAVWWAVRQLQELEDQCCDAIVVEIAPHAAKSYATALLDTLDFLCERTIVAPLGATAARNQKSLARRIAMLKNRSTTARLTLGRLMLLLAVAALPMALAFGQKAPEATDKPFNKALPSASHAVSRLTPKNLPPKDQKPVTGRNFVIVPFTTELQRAASGKYADAKVFVLINGTALLKDDDSVLDAKALDYGLLRKALWAFVPDGSTQGCVAHIIYPAIPRYPMLLSASSGFLGFLVAQGWHSDTDERNNVEQLVYNTDKIDWASVVAELAKPAHKEDVRRESGIGDNLVKAYPICTPLSRFLYGGSGENCVIRNLKPMDQLTPKETDILAQGARTYVAKLALKEPPRLRLLIHFGRDEEKANRAYLQFRHNIEAWCRAQGGKFCGLTMWEAGRPITSTHPSEKDKAAPIAPQATGNHGANQSPAARSSAKPGMETRTINRLVKDFPEKVDLSTPESAAAACSRVAGSPDPKVWLDLSAWTYTARDVADIKRKMKLHRDWLAKMTEAYGNAEIVEVLTYRDGLAEVISKLKLSGGDRNPYSARTFVRIGSDWKNFGENRAASLEAARTNFDRYKDTLWGNYLKVLDGIAKGKRARLKAGDLSSSRPKRSAPIAPGQPLGISVEKADLMGRVEWGMMHGMRDITARKTIEWSDVGKDADGNRTIRYKYYATIWDKDVYVMNQVFTFDAKGNVLNVEDVEGFPQKKVAKPVDVSTQAGMKDLVEDFFSKNFRDITARETIEWGQVAKAADGTSSIRYKYRATIWDKDVKIMNQVFVFDPKGKFVSVKNVEGFPKNP